MRGYGNIASYFFFAKRAVALMEAYIYKEVNIMKNGFFERSEINLVMYEYEANDSNDFFVIITKDGHENEPVIVNGDLARELVMDVMAKIDKAFDNKEES